MDGLNLNTLIGPGEVGAFIATVLFGCAVVQVYMYYEEFQNDHWGLKMLITVLCLFQIGHMVSLIAAVYIMTVTNYGEPQTLAILPHACYLSAIFSPLVALGAQGYYAYRLHKLSRSLTIPLFCFALAIVRVVLVIIVSIAGYISVDAKSFEQQWGHSTTALLAVSAVCDLTLAAAMCYNLRQQGKFATEHTSLHISRVIIWTIETGLVTGLTEIAEVACFLTMPDNYIWMGIYSFASGVYLNSLLVVLNRRAHVRREMPQVHKLSSRHFSTRGPRATSQSVRIDVSQISASDCQSHGKTDVETSMEFA